MRIVSFLSGGTPRFGCRRTGGIVAFAGEPGRSFDALCDALSAGASPATEGPVLPDGDLEILAPVPRPGKIICIGLNYADHAREGGHPIPTYPAVFLRVANSIAGPGKPLVKPTESERFDYEAELAVIIGRRGRRIARSDALTHVAGYSCFNDGSLRDYQRKSTQWTMGKNFDGSGSLGPELVTPDELPDGPGTLRVVARLNGEVLQDGNTRDMIFDIPTIIATLSEVMTLEPGDVIATGTPAGVGFARTPPVFMRPGDVCEIEIEGVGLLRNPIAADQAQ